MPACDRAVTAFFNYQAAALLPRRQGYAAAQPASEQFPGRQQPATARYKIKFIVLHLGIKIYLRKIKFALKIIGYCCRMCLLGH